jgi:hypothetical protein
VKRLQFTRRSRRHRIGRASAVYVIENTDAVEDVFEPTGDTRYTWHGLDERGREAGDIALDRPDCILVIHVMPNYRGRKS